MFRDKLKKVTKKLNSESAFKTAVDVAIVAILINSLVTMSRIDDLENHVKDLCDMIPNCVVEYHK